MCDRYNDRALEYYIKNCEQPTPHSILGQRYSSKCVDRPGLKRMQRVPLDSDFSFPEQLCDHDVVGYSVRVERPIGRVGMINRKYMQFASELSD